VPKRLLAVLVLVIVGLAVALVTVFGKNTSGTFLPVTSKAPPLPKQANAPD
jgi:hypothetical protein